MNYLSECCAADTITELHYHSDLDMTTGICSKCKDHCSFDKVDENDEQ